MRFILIIPLLLLSLIGQSQTTYPTNQWFGSASTLTTFNGAAKVTYGFVHGRYADTTAANATGYIKFYPGASIVTGDTVWLRNSVATQWLVANGSGGGGGSGANPLGTYVVQTAANAPANAQILASLSTGLVKNTTATGVLSIAVPGVDYLVSGSITASQGLSVIGNDVRLGTALNADGAPFAFKRRVDLNRQFIRFTNGYPSTDSTSERWSTFQILQIDTVNTLTVDYDSIGKALISAKRIFRYAPGVRTLTNRFGSIFAIEHQATDSVVIRTNDGDYSTNAFFLRLGSDPSWTGRTVYRAGHTGGSPVTVTEWAAAGLSKVFLNNLADSGTNNTNMRFIGGLVGQRAYISGGNFGKADTLDAFAFFSTGSYINAPTRVTKMYAFYPQWNSNHSDSTFGWYDRSMFAYNLFSGKSTFGPGPHTYSHHIKNNGTTYLNDSVTTIKRIAQTDSTGIDFIVRDRTSGLNKHIAGGSLTSIIGATLYSGDGTLAGNRIVNLNGNTLSVQHGGNSFLSIDPTANNEQSYLRAYNTTDDDNYSIFSASTSNLSSDFNIVASFNGESSGALITGHAESGLSALTYAADTHTITGAVIFSNLAGNGVGVVGIDNAGVISFTTALANPMTTLNDIIAGGSGGTPIRVAAGSAGQFLRVKLDNTGLEYVTLSGGGDALTANPLSQFASTTSAQLAGVISNETGSGLLVYATAPSMSSITLAAGTASAGTAPIYFTAGVELTTPVSGAFNYVGTNFLSTTESGRGVTPSVQYIIIQQDFPLADVNTIQTCVPTSADLITLQGGTTYEWEAQINIACGSAAHTFGMGFTVGGAGSIDTLRHTVMAWAGVDNNVASVQGTSRWTHFTASGTQMASSAVAGNNAICKGLIVVAPGGTVELTPTIIFGSAPGGVNLLKRLSYWKFWPVGSNTVTTIGNIQ